MKPVPHAVKRGFGNGHSGIDYLSPHGSLVRASADGKVDFAGNGAGHGWVTWMGGKYILLKHPKRYSGYAHLSRIVVRPGQSVKAGQIIGYSGNSGFVDPKPTWLFPKRGSHLHYEELPLVPNFKNGTQGRVEPTLIKPTVAKPKPAPKRKAVYYTVKKGDTFSTIAAKYRLSLTKLANLNPRIKNVNVIYPGQKIRVK